MTNTLEKIMHNGDEYMLPRQKALVITLTSAGWTNNEQTVTATGVTANNSVIISPVPASISDYADAGIYCSAQGTDSLTFTCDSTPASDIDVNVVVLSAEIEGGGGGGGWTPGANTIAYYPLESDVKDYSGNNNDGTNNGVTFSNVGGVDCAVFTSSSTRILLPGLGSFTNLTMSAWFKTTASYAGSTIIMLAPSTDNKNIDLSIENGTARLSRYTGVSYNITDGTVNNGVWHNIIGTYTSTGGTKLYVDGVFINSDLTTTQVKSDSGYSCIGGHAQGYSWATFDGNISNVIIETAERTAQEVSDYFDLTKGDYGIGGEGRQPGEQPD